MRACDRQSIMKPTLFSSPGSHHSRRVAVLVHELGLDVEIKPVDVRPSGMGGENDSAAFRELNPNAKVPVLKDGDLVLWESSAIMWYLADAQTGGRETPLYPRDPARRAEIAKWHLWQAAHLSPAADGLMYEAFVRPMTGAPADENALAAHTKSFHRFATVLDAALARSPYLAGNDFTTADIAVASALMWARPVKMPIDGYANVVAWLARVQARPSWKATEPPPMGGGKRDAKGG
jgi:glutathione S-transferase